MEKNMFIKIITTVLSGMFIFNTLGIQEVIAQSDAKTSKIREKVYKYGLAKKVLVKLKDKTKFKGSISKIEKEAFKVTDKAGKESTFSYSEVIQVKKSGVPVGVWIAIGAAAAVGTILLVSLSKRCRNEGGNALCL